MEGKLQHLNPTRGSQLREQIIRYFIHRFKLYILSSQGNGTQRSGPEVLMHMAGLYRRTQKVWITSQTLRQLHASYWHMNPPMSNILWTEGATLADTNHQMFLVCQLDVIKRKISVVHLCQFWKFWKSDG